MLEGFVGTLPENTDEESPITKCTDREAWFVDGQCSMYDFLSFFDSEDLMEDSDFTTVAGLCISLFERIPATGESVEWNNFRFEIADKDEARIDKLLVTLISAPTL